MSASFVHFLTRFLNIVTYNPFTRSWQISMFCVKLMTCCDLEKYRGHHVLATLCVQRLYVQFILVGGLLTGSDTCITSKIDAIWLMFVNYGPVVTLKIQPKVQKSQI